MFYTSLVWQTDREPAPYNSPLIVIDRPGQNTAVTYEARCIDRCCVWGMPEKIRF